MSTNRKFTFKASTKTTLDLYNYLENRMNEGRLNLSPDYQRDIVWTDADRAAYLESLYIGFAPSILIFNKESDNSLVCIDGKQRIDTIRRFYNGKIPMIIGDDYVYYKAVPDDTIFENTRVLTNNEKTEFQDIVMYNHEYNKLSYDEQVDLFNRIQQGKKLTAGEIVKSSLSKTVNNRIQRIMNRYVDRLDKYVIKKRENMYYFFVKFISLLGSDELTIVRGVVCSRFDDNNHDFDFDKACKKANMFFKNRMDLLDESKMNKRYEHLLLILCYRLCNYLKEHPDTPNETIVQIINKYREIAVKYDKSDKLKVTQSSNKALKSFSGIFDEAVKGISKEIQKELVHVKDDHDVIKNITEENNEEEVNEEEVNEEVNEEEINEEEINEEIHNEEIHNEEVSDEQEQKKVKPKRINKKQGTKLEKPKKKSKKVINKKVNKKTK